MKFLLNTSFEPYFCAVFDQHLNLIDSVHWTEGRKSGQLIWDFIEEHQLKDQSVDFLGAVSGPGGFSHLRSSGVILNALSFYFDLPMHQARADKVIYDFLALNHKKVPIFALNSFGTGLFLVIEKELKRFKSQDEINTQKFNEIEIWDALLPPNKKDYFPLKHLASLEGVERSTLETLLKEPGQNHFVPDYEYPAVQA